MKKGFVIIASLAAALLAGCVNINRDNPYDGTLCRVNVELVFPEEFRPDTIQGLPVDVEDILNTYKFTALSDDRGRASIDLPKGLYRFTFKYSSGAEFLNAAAERVQVLEPKKDLTLKLIYSSAGALVVKEIYSGGCKYYSESGEYLGNYQSDKYMILHNNLSRTVYLDSLCVGCVSPYNSTANSPWIKTQTADGRQYLDVYAPIVQAVWQFGGNGTTFPLKPGEDAVIAFNGAIDHTVKYANSVNLNKAEYFVCYNSTYFTNPSYHPAPGDQIREDHILNVVIKLGQANAYTVSVSSPAMVIFKPEGYSVQDYISGKVPTVSGDNPVIQQPGADKDRILNVPWEWVLDGIEVFSGQSSNNTKRLSIVADAGYATLTDTYLGHTVMRKTDEQLTATAGYEVLVDTNNSTNDCYERNTPSLHE